MAGEDGCDDFMWWYCNYFQSWHHSCDGDCYAAAADGDDDDDDDDVDDDDDDDDDVVVVVVVVDVDDCSACSGGVTGFLWIFDVEIVASHYASGLGLRHTTLMRLEARAESAMFVRHLGAGTRNIMASLVEFTSQVSQNFSLKIASSIINLITQQVHPTKLPFVAVPGRGR